MNNWGITKRVLRTDADLEEAVVDIKEDKSSITENIDMTSEVGIHEEVEAQLNTLNQAPGKIMYEQWMQSERAKDDAAMAKILANTAIRSTLTAQYQLMANMQNSQVVSTIPTEVFLNFNKTDQQIEQERQVALCGNLSKYW